MQAVKHGFLVLLSILLIAVIAAALLAHSLQASILRPYSTGDYITRSGLHEQLSLSVKEQLSQLAGSLKVEGTGQGGRVEQFINEVALRGANKAVAMLVTPEWLRSLANTYQAHIWDYVLEVTERVEPLVLKDFHEALRASMEEELGGVAGALVPERLREAVFKAIEEHVPLQLDLLPLLQLDYEQLDKLKRVYQLAGAPSEAGERGEAGTPAEEGGTPAEADNGATANQKLHPLFTIAGLVAAIGLLIAFYVRPALLWLGSSLLAVGAASWIGALWLRASNDWAEAPFLQTTPARLRIGVSQMLEQIQADILGTVIPAAQLLAIGGLLCIVLALLPIVGAISKRQRTAWGGRGVLAGRLLIAGVLVVVAIWQAQPLTVLYGLL